MLLVASGYIIVKSHAAIPGVGAEAESGTLVAPAAVQSDSTASGGSDVAFGSVLSSAVFGVYYDTFSEANVTAFANTTGVTPKIMEVYMDGGSGFAGISNSNFGWTNAAGTGTRLEIGMGVCNGSFAAPVGDLADGAAGNYNQYWQAFAKEMIKEGFGNSIIRVGVELTGNWNACSLTDATDATNYAAYYRQIVNTMRAEQTADQPSIPANQKFQFIWEIADPQDGKFAGKYTSDQAWPGDSYVDYIGTDTYDQTWVSNCNLPFNGTATATQSQCAWNNGTLPQLTGVANYAAAHGKPVVFPEWGLAIRSDGHGLGDDPTFIDNMHQWMSTNNVGFDVYFNSDSGGQTDMITDGNFPKALAEFEKVFK